MIATTTVRKPTLTPALSWAADALIAAVTLGASLALILHGGVPTMPSDGHLDAVSAALAACATLPLLAWRLAPFSIFVVTATASAVTVGAGYAPGAPLGPTVALFLLTCSRGESRPWTRDMTTATVLLFVTYGVATAAAQPSAQAGVLLHVGLAWGIAWFAGERTRLHREHLADLKQRVQRTERDAQRERDLAAAEERARIARDLHDSAGHAISLIAVKAGAARLRHNEYPDRSRAALQDIEELARHTADEIDEIVGALRDRGGAAGSAEAPAGLASVDRLVRRHATAGLDVTLRMTGTRRPLDGPVDIAAYRILQEALNNASKHGLGGASVQVEFGEVGLELTVTNPTDLNEPAGVQNGGHGLVGMRERAALLHGAFDAARDNGIFRVRADLPYEHQRS